MEHYEILDHGIGDTIDHTDQGEVGDNEEMATHHDLSNYQLTRDREKRVIKTPKRYGHADIICYALSVAEEKEQGQEGFRVEIETAKGREREGREARIVGLERERERKGKKK